MNSDVSNYWEAIAAKFGDTRKWNDLTLQQQQIVMQSINALLAVLHHRI